MARLGRRMAGETAALLSRLRGAPARAARIVYYHRIDDEDHRSCVTPTAFAAQMHFLRHEGWQPIALEALTDALAGQTALPERSVAITFDDGFADNFSAGLPVLLRHEIPATVFLTAGFIGTSDLPVLRDRRGLTPLSWPQVREMASHGIEIGAHTLSHPELPTLGNAALDDEIRGSRRLIEEQLGSAIQGFCYPRGRYDERVVEAVRRAGFAWACSTRPGSLSPTTPLFELPRTFIARDDSLADFRLKLEGGFDLLHSIRQARAARAAGR